MPTYEYLNTLTGKTVERTCPVAERDNVPAHLKRQIASVMRDCFGFMGRDSCREPGVDEGVPKAFRQLEDQQGWRKTCREAGFSVDHIRRTWNMVALITCLLALSAGAADVLPGYTFTDTDHVTASKLNSAAAGSINTSFFTGQNAAFPVDVDTFLFYSQSALGFRRVALSTLLINNTNLIGEQIEDTLPATNDYVLTYKPGTNQLRKVQVGNLFLPLTFTCQSNIAPDGTYSINVAHGLGGTPQVARCVFFTTSAYGGVPAVPVGTEVDISLCRASANINASLILPAADISVDSTNVYVSVRSTSDGGQILIPRKATLQNNSTTNNQAVKVYLYRFQ